MSMRSSRESSRGTSIRGYIFFCVRIRRMMPKRCSNTPTERRPSRCGGEAGGSVQPAINTTSSKGSVWPIDERTLAIVLRVQPGPLVELESIPRELRGSS